MTGLNFFFVSSEIDRIVSSNSSAFDLMIHQILSHKALVTKLITTGLTHFHATIK